jgi:16S rRNA (guanine966-N2)-methyltransferase
MFDVLFALPEVRAGEAAAPFAGPLAGHVVLDLFAGSGALGIEALSRGASACTFVENERAALRALRANLERVGVTVAGKRREEDDAGESVPRAHVRATDARRALQADARLGARYTLLFADPPYDRYAEVRPALARLLGPLLAPHAVVVVETAAGTAAGLPWSIVREKRYGDTRVTFLVAADPADDEGAAGNDDRPVT